MLFLFARVLCAAAPRLLWAQADTLRPGPLTADRPDETESTSIVPLGFVQIEAGWSFEAAEHGGIWVRTHTLPGLLARVGVTHALEARLGLPGLQLASGAAAAQRSGLGDAELGFKYRLVAAARGRPGAALIGGVSVPTGSDAVTSGGVDPSVLLALSAAFGDRLSVGSNLGSTWTARAGGGSGRAVGAHLTYTLSLAVALSGRIGMFAETFGTVPVPGGASAHAVDGGVTWLVRDNLQFDVSGGRGVGGGAGVTWTLGAGLVLRLPR